MYTVPRIIYMKLDHLFGPRQKEAGRRRRDYTDHSNFQRREKLGMMGAEPMSGPDPQAHGGGRGIGPLVDCR